jgi:hypothetical protein
VTLDLLSDTMVGIDEDIVQPVTDGGLYRQKAQQRAHLQSGFRRGYVGEPATHDRDGATAATNFEKAGILTSHWHEILIRHEECSYRSVPTMGDSTRILSQFDSRFENVRLPSLTQCYRSSMIEARKA